MRPPVTRITSVPAPRRPRHLDQRPGRRRSFATGTVRGRRHGLIWLRP